MQLGTPMVDMFSLGHSATQEHFYRLPLPAVLTVIQTQVLTLQAGSTGTQAGSDFM